MQFVIPYLLHLLRILASPSLLDIARLVVLLKCGFLILLEAIGESDHERASPAKRTAIASDTTTVGRRGTPSLFLNVGGFISVEWILFEKLRVSQMWKAETCLPQNVASLLVLLNDR